MKSDWEWFRKTGEINPHFALCPSWLTEPARVGGPIPDSPLVLKLIKVFLNWRIMVLCHQQCDFCHASASVSHRYHRCLTPSWTFSTLPPHPSSSCPEHWVGLPASIEQILTRYLFYNWYMYMFQYYSFSSSHPFHPPLCPVSGPCVSICCPHK